MNDRQINRKRALQNIDNYFKSKTYFNWRVGRAKKFILLSKKYVPLNKKTVLDFGCGMGPLSYILYQKGAKTHAVDVDNESLKAMKRFTKNMKIKIKRIAGESLPYPDNFFDLIFAFDVIEHVKNCEKSFIEMKRCLKKGGYIFLEITPYYALATGHHLYDFTHLPVQYLPKKLSKWWVLGKKPNKGGTAREAWDQFTTLNKISITKIRGLFKKHQLEIVKENFIFKISRSLEAKINWIKYFGPLKEIIPMSYQAVLKKE